MCVTRPNWELIIIMLCISYSRSVRGGGGGGGGHFAPKRLGVRGPKFTQTGVSVVRILTLTAVSNFHKNWTKKSG